MAYATPYNMENTQKGKRHLENYGIEVVSHCILPGVTNIYDETAERAYGLARMVDHADADAVFLSGVGMPTITALNMLESDLNKSVISSASAMMWNALRIIGVRDSIPRRRPAADRQIHPHRELKTMAYYLTEHDVQKLLTMSDALIQVERSFVARAEGQAFDIPRKRTRLPGGHLHILQGAADELNVVGHKAYYLQPGKSRCSLLTLIDREQGNLLAIIESDWLSQIRTGAATGVAIKHLARKNSEVLGLFGSGRHAVTQLMAACEVQPFKEVKVFGRDTDRLRAFCREMEPRVGTTVRPAGQVPGRNGKRLRRHYYDDASQRTVV